MREAAGFRQFLCFSARGEAVASLLAANIMETVAALVPIESGATPGSL